MPTRRQFLTRSTKALAAASVAAKSATADRHQRLIIDTHIEFWTSEPRFPFNHPENPDFKRARMDAPVENFVEQMKDFNVKYAVIINPRYFGWDNSYMSYCYHTYKNLFVAHGLINPEHPKVAEHLRYWVTEHGFQGMRFSRSTIRNRPGSTRKSTIPSGRRPRSSASASTTTSFPTRCRCSKTWPAASPE